MEEGGRGEVAGERPVAGETLPAPFAVGTVGLTEPPLPFGEDAIVVPSVAAAVDGFGEVGEEEATEGVLCSCCVAEFIWDKEETSFPPFSSPSSSSELNQISSSSSS